MKTIMRLIAAAALGLAVQLGHAAGEDLAACRYANGNTIDPKVCDVLRQHQQRMAGVAARQEADRAESERLETERKAKADAVAAERSRTLAEEIARRQQAESQMKADYEAAAAESAAIEAKREKICGKDYQVVRIGMSMKRVVECYSDFDLVRQVSRADGVVSVYDNGSVVVHAKAGRVLAWTAR